MEWSGLILDGQCSHASGLYFFFLTRPHIIILWRTRSPECTQRIVALDFAGYYCYFFSFLFNFFVLSIRNVKPTVVDDNGGGGERVGRARHPRPSAVSLPDMRGRSEGIYPQTITII